MVSVCIYLQVHQPFRVESSIDDKRLYFGPGNKEIFLKVAKNSYLPTNKILLELLKKYNNFKLTLSFSGTVLEQMERFSPETLKSFQDLYKTGKTEILSETYYHSLAFFYSKSEFEKQVELHNKKIKIFFNTNPKIFRNTELSYNNNLAKWAEKKGYKAILTEGWGPVLKGRSSNFLYKPKGTKDIKVLLKNYQLSDTIAFRFSSSVNTKNFSDAVKKSKGDTINLFMDYETFGEHRLGNSGILLFLESLPKEVLKRKITFKTASETVDSYKTKGLLDVPKVLTWADTARDLSAWAGNKMQKSSLKNLYEIENLVLETNNKKIIDDWRKLQTSDHFYYMCTTKWVSDGQVHSYFSPHKNPQDAHFFYTNILNDLKKRIREKNISQEKLQK